LVLVVWISPGWRRVILGLRIDQRVYSLTVTKCMKLVDFVGPASEARANQEMGRGVKIPAIRYER
jgi:hypothetical protein